MWIEAGVSSEKSNEMGMELESSDEFGRPDGSIIRLLFLIRWWIIQERMK